SFFPRHRLFFLSALLWAALAMAGWYAGGRDLGPILSLGSLIGFPYPAAAHASGGDHAAQTIAMNRAIDIWLDQYMIVAGAIFAGIWAFIAPHRWFRWSVVASSVILLTVWLQVQLDLMVTDWFRSFYD